MIYKELCPVQISIVIPCRDSADTLELTLQSVQRLELPPLETIIIDDGSKKPICSLAKSYGAICYRLDVGKGPAFARNYGAKKAKGNIILFIDADVTIASDALTRITDDFTNHDIAAVQGVYHPGIQTDNLVSKYQNYYYHHAFTSINIKHIAVCATYCFAIRRDLFLSTGGFDTGITKPTVEDEAFGYYFAAKGHIISLNTHVFVYHHARYNLTGFIKRKIRMSFNQIKSFIRGNRPPSSNRILKKDQNRTHHSSRVLFGTAIAPLIPIGYLFHWIPGLLITIFYIILNLKFWSYIVSKDSIIHLPIYLFLTWVDHLSIFAGIAFGLAHYVSGKKY